MLLFLLLIRELNLRDNFPSLTDQLFCRKFADYVINDELSKVNKNNNDNFYLSFSFYLCLIVLSKKLSLCHKIKFSNQHIFSA